MSLLVPIYNTVQALAQRLSDALAKRIADHLDTPVSTRLASDDARLDHLDQAVSSRANAADYTSARAALIDLLAPLTHDRVVKLDHLDHNVSAVMAALNAYSPIKSIQRGTFYKPQPGPIEIPIAPVDPSKCHVSLYGGFGTSLGPTYHLAYIDRLTRTTLVVSSQANWCYLSWEIIEYV